MISSIYGYCVGHGKWPFARLCGIFEFPVFLLLLLLIAGAFPCVVGAAPPVYAVGDEVCVQWAEDWRWYEAEVTEVAADLVEVHYPEYGSAWDQWVGLEEVNPRYTPTVGGQAWVEWRLNYYTATILQTMPSGQYEVHYEGYDSSWDEEVNPCRVFPLPEVNDPVWVKWGLSWYYARILETDTNRWKVHYVGYGSSWDEYVDPTRIMPCTQAQAAQAESSGTSTGAAQVPSGINAYPYEAVASPVVDSNPSQAKPVGVGAVFGGGSTLTLALGLPAYVAGVDVYFGYSHESSPEIYVFGADGSIRPASSGLVPMIAGTTGPVSQTLLQDLPIAGFPLGRYNVYLLVSPAGGLSSFNLWYTGFSLSTAGIFTGYPLLDSAALLALLAPYISDMVANGDVDWYAEAQQFIATYTDADGALNPAEARAAFMWAAYLEDNVYPFCWAALKAVEADPTDALALNSAAVCLLELGETDEAGRVLDFAHYQDPQLSLTHENAAVYFDKKGDAARAATEKLNALDGEPSWAHDAWDGYHYALGQGLSSAAGQFDSRLPSNYSLLKSDGSQGGGAAATYVCCSCNGQFYTDVVLCVDECHVSLACFTSICTPRLHCCGQKTPFSLEAGLCYPPNGLQACIEADNTGNYTVKLGGKIAGLFGTYVGLSTNFSGNYNVAFSFSGSTGGKASVTLLTSDPNTRTGAAQFIWNPSGSVAGGLGLGANLEASSWPRSPICELNPP
jgi:hypothetical protein